MGAADMQSLRHKAQVLDGLGEKVLEGLAMAVDHARGDLARYRRTLPDFVAQSSPRGLANWIHDRVWHRACQQLDSVDGVVLYEKGATREIIVKDRYRMRVKRHRAPATVATYPTQGAMDFMAQPSGQLVLEGLEQLRLIVGYQWEADRADLGPAVLSMRHGIRSVLWVHELAGAETRASQLPRRIAPEAAVVRSRLEAMGDDERRRSRKA